MEEIFNTARDEAEREAEKAAAEAAAEKAKEEAESAPGRPFFSLTLFLLCFFFVSFC